MFLRLIQRKKKTVNFCKRNQAKALKTIIIFIRKKITKK